MTTKPPTRTDPDDPGTPAGPDQRLARVTLDAQGAFEPGLEAERTQALADLQTDGRFAIANRCGPYALTLAIRDGRLLFDVVDGAGARLPTFGLALGPFRSLIKDYGLLLNSYATAMQEGREARIQSIDMGRRGLHNEAAALLKARLGGRFAMDTGTARRLFTLLYALHGRLVSSS